MAAESNCVKAMVALTLAVAVALSCATAATAASSPSREVRVLRHRLHQMTLARDAAKAEAAALQTQVASLQGQVSSLQAQASTLQAQVASLQGQASSLQAQLAAIPTPFQVAVNQVRDEVSWAQRYGLPYSYGRLVSQAAMAYVVGHVSPAEYGYLELNGLPLPGAGSNGNPSPDSILGPQAGICGHAAVVLAALMHHFGVPVRSVQFYYDDPAPSSKPDSHIAVETYYEGGWHFYDPTFGNYWVDGDGRVLSILDARAGLGSLHRDDASFTNLYEDWQYGNSIAFETDPTTVVALDEQKFHY